MTNKWPAFAFALTKTFYAAIIVSPSIDGIRRWDTHNIFLYTKLKKPTQFVALLQNMDTYAKKLKHSVQSFNMKVRV